MCRSITLAGGLLLLIWSENDKQRRNENMGIPMDAEEVGADRLQLCGRLFLTFIFFFQAAAPPPRPRPARRPCPRPRTTAVAASPRPQPPQPHSTALPAVPSPPPTCRVSGDIR